MRPSAECHETETLLFLWRTLSPHDPVRSAVPVFLPCPIDGELVTLELGNDDPP